MSRSVDELLGVVARPPAAGSSAVRAVMQGNRRRDSRAELSLRRELHRRGLRYRVDFGVRVPGHRLLRPDIVFTRARVAVFVDGCYWHGCPEHFVPPRSNRAYWTAKIELNQARDQRQVAALRAAGWEVVRSWEHADPAAAADLVEQVVRRRSAVPQAATSAER